MERKRKKRSGRRRGGSHEYGQTWMLAAALLDRPRTAEELEEYFHIMGRRFGVFFPHGESGVGFGGKKNEGQENGGRENGDQQLPFSRQLRAGIRVLLERGWAYEQEGRYHLTEEGREEAERMIADMDRGGRFLEKAASSRTVSTVTMIVHFLLAAVKLPAGLLSGSVGLLNDALDTLIDGVASLFVYFGVRSGRERAVSYLLLFFMALTGIYTLYETVISFISPAELRPDPLAAAAVGASAALCGLLWLYQKYTGVRNGCVPLIAQSIDSRNHVLVAGGVGAGLVAAHFQVYLLDQVVGLAVAVLILKGAFELLVDLLRSEGEEELDLSRYGFTRLEAQRKRQMVRWLLYAVEEGRVRSRGEMEAELQSATDFSQVASLRALGLDSVPGHQEKVREAVEEVFSRGLAEENEHLLLTPAGQEELRKALTGERAFPGGRPAGGPHRRGFRLLAFLLRFIWTGILFAGGYLLAGWLLAYLPPLEPWSGADGLGGIHLFPADSPFSMNPIQGALWLAGLALFYRGRMLLHRSRHLIHHAREGDRLPAYLITWGDYALRRHPMNTGFLLLYLGVGTGMHSVYLLLFTALMALLWIASAWWEESRLRSRFGEEYRSYCRQVPCRFLSIPGWCAALAAYAAAWAGMLWQ